MDNQVEMADLPTIREQLTAKDINRLLLHFEALDLGPEAGVPSGLVIPLYEIMLRPSLLDSEAMVNAPAFPLLMGALCKWRPRIDTPTVDITRIAYGILRLIGSTWAEVSQWAKAFSWHDFSEIRFAAHFDAILRLWESLITSGERLETDFYYGPPNPGFYELMIFTLRRTSHLTSTIDLFGRYRLFSRVLQLASSGMMQVHRSLEMVQAVLHKDANIWGSTPKPLSRAIELITTLIEPCMDPKNMNSPGTVNTALQVLQGLVAVANSNFSVDEYLVLVNKAGFLIASVFEEQKDNPIFRRCVKEIVQTGFEKRPPLVADISLKNLWTRLVDPKLDAPILRAAHRAEAEYLRHAILDDIHEAPEPRKALFPQRMIVSSVLDAPSLIIDVLCHCCTISLLDLKNTHSVLREKHVNIAREVMNHIGIALENAAKNADKAQWSAVMKTESASSDPSAPVFRVSDAHKKMVASAAVYWLSSSQAHASFHRFLAIATFDLKRTGPEGTLESSLFLKYPRHTALGLRSLLWDFQMLRYKCCASSFPTALDMISRFMQTDWFKDAVPSSASVASVSFGAPSSYALNGKASPDTMTAEEIVADILPLAWMLVKHVLTPHTAVIDSYTVKASVRGVMGAPVPIETKRSFLNTKAIDGAFRTLIVLFSQYSHTFVIQRAIENVMSWLPTFLRVPMWLKDLKELESDTIAMWKGASMSIRKRLLANKLTFGMELNDVLQSVIELITPTEWANLLQTPLRAQVLPGATSNTITSTWEKKQQKPVINGSALIMGGGSTPRALPSSLAKPSGTSSNTLYSASPSNTISKKNSATTTAPMLPNHLRAQVGLPKHVPEPTPPPGMTLQEKKEADAELQRLAAEKRKREFGAPEALEEAIVVKNTVVNRSKAAGPSSNAHEKKKRMLAMDDLFDRVTDLAFHTLTFPKDFTAGANTVPNEFSTAEEYMSAFEPLMFVELEAQLQSARDDLVAETSTQSITYKREVGDYVEITVRKQFRWTVGSLFLMWPKSSKEAATELPLYIKDAGLLPHCIGVVTNVKDRKRNKGGGGGYPGAPAPAGAGLTVEGDDTTERLHVRVHVNASTKDHRSGLAPKLQIGTDWNFCEFFSITTVLRQWSSLQTIESLHHLPDLLKPSCSDSPRQMAHISSNNAREMSSKLSNQRKFNDSQRAAVESSLKTRGFSFIQGPPGTGKTRTLVGLLSAVIALQGAPVLICTPSNSAVNEVIDRIMSFGLYDMSSSSPDAFIKNFSLVRIGSHPDTPDRIKQLQLRELAMKDMDRVRKEGMDKVEASILKKAEIVCSTLSGSASGVLTHGHIDFKTVIIDEAAQAVELETLIPLQYRCEQCIMIGDPQQLPATVFAKNNFLYERSLFARFSETMAKHRILLLNTQYRMHPDISLFPNRHFYGGKLIDGTTTEPADWYSSLQFPDVPASTGLSSATDSSDLGKASAMSRNVFSSLRFFDITGSFSGGYGGARSMGNQDEVNFVVALIYKLLAKNPKLVFDNKIVVITPYQLQRSMMKRAFAIQVTKHPIFGLIEVATVDSYQGREQDIVIVSTVRATKGQSIGFLSDVRRLNVALTRAKKSLWIIGKASTLIVNPEWKKLLDSLKERQLMTPVATKPEAWWDAL